MSTTAKHNNEHAYRRVKQKQREAAIKQTLSSLPKEYISKLRHECLVAANAQLRGASPEEIVAEATRHFEARLRFLTEKAEKKS